MKRLKRASGWVGYVLFYALSRPLLILPLSWLYLFSDLFFVFLWYFPGYRKDVVTGNLRMAFPDKDSLEIRRIARAFYRHLGDSFIESFATATMSPRELNRRCRWKNPEILAEYFKNGKSVISVFGHYGNWEWLLGLPLHTELKVIALYKPLRNVWFNRYMKRLRERFGLTAVPANRCMQELICYTRENIPTITFFLGDQRPLKENIRYWTKFLNQDTPVLLGTEKIAKKLDQAVVFLIMRKLKRGHYEVEIVPVTNDPCSTGKYEITESHLRLLEKQIIGQPEYWLWSHKRWKHKPENS